MLFRNYSNRHLSYGHLSRKKQRWDASTNYDSISTEDEDDDKEEDTANCGGTSIQWNRRRLPNQWRRRSTLEDHSDEESSSDTGEISFSLDNDGEEEEGDDIISIQAQRQLSPVAAAAQDNTSDRRLKIQYPHGAINVKQNRQYGENSTIKILVYIS